MPALGCSAPEAVEDLDQTFFIEFLSLRLPGKGNVPATYPGAGGRSKPPKQTKAGNGKKAPYDPTRRLLDSKRAFESKKSPSTVLNYIRQIDTHTTTMAHGGLFAVHGIPVGKVRWLLGMQYQQSWKRSDVGAGRLLAVVPIGLYPATKKIDIRVWDKTIETSSDTLTSETLYSTEITSSDKWSFATKKMFATETASEIKPSATLNSVGVSVPGTVTVQGSGNLGIAGTFSDNVKNQVDTTADYIAEQTVKAAFSLKSSRTVKVETTRESGSERTVSETLVNPNRGSTLNYLYWEILETYKVDTTFERVDLYMAIPLPIDTDPTPEWLLKYECALSPHLPCELFVRGFEATKAHIRLTKQIALIDAQIATETKNLPAAASLAGTTLITKLTDLLTIYDKVSTANPANGLFGSWIYWSLLNIVAGNDLARGLTKLKTDFTALTAPQDPVAVAEVVDAGFAVIGDLDDVFTRVGAAVASLATFSIFAGCGVVPPLGIALVVLITALAVTLDGLGIDVLPDDEGLQDATRAVKKAVDAFRASVASPPPAAPAAAAPGGYDHQLRHALRRDELQAQLDDVDVEYNRLRDHVREEIYKYHHAIWASWSGSRIARAINDTGVDPMLVERRFYGFDEDYAFVRVVDIGWLERGGLKWRIFAKSVADTARIKGRTLVLPAPGAWAEAVRGRCDALDGFMARHRDIDLAVREAMAAASIAKAGQEEAELERLKARVAAGILDDPSPYRRADKIEVEVEASSDGTAPASEGSPTGDTDDDG